MKLRLNVHIDREIEFIASHIWEFSIEAIRDIDIGVIERIWQRG
jgi:hypothetical protein